MYHCRLVLLVLELYINGLIKYTFTEQMSKIHSLGCVSVVIYVLLLNGIPYEYTTFPLDRSLGCFLFWAIMNKAMILWMYLSSYLMDIYFCFSGVDTYEWIVSLQYMCMVNVMRNCQSDYIIFTLLPVSYANCSCFTIFANSWSYQYLILAVPVGLKWYLFRKIQVLCYIYLLCFMIHLKLISFL